MPLFLITLGCGRQIYGGEEFVRIIGLGHLIDDPRGTGIVDHHTESTTVNDEPFIFDKIEAYVADLIEDIHQEPMNIPRTIGRPCKGHVPRNSIRIRSNC
jgi:hypothetical protein